MSAGTDRPDWARDGADWPNRDTSRRVVAGGLSWHVQVAGAGPVVLLLHGTGAATHSWAGLLPLLARDFTVVAPDLPGHGFTGPRPGLSLPVAAGLVAALIAELGAAPALAVGHSAGAAILARLVLERRIAPRALVALAGALTPFRGVAGLVFPVMARVLTLNPLIPRLFARSAGDPAAVARLIEGTGSRLEPGALALYGRLLARPGHVAGALDMMANWALEPLFADLPKLGVPLELIAGGRDRAVPLAEQRRVAGAVPGASLTVCPDLGHLLHEEDPAAIATLIVAVARRHGVLSAEVPPG